MSTHTVRIVFCNDVSMAERTHTDRPFLCPSIHPEDVKGEGSEWPKWHVFIRVHSLRTITSFVNDALINNLQYVIVRNYLKKTETTFNEGGRQKQFFQFYFMTYEFLYLHIWYWWQLPSIFWHVILRTRFLKSLKVILKISQKPPFEECLIFKPCMKKSIPITIIEWNGE